MLVERLVFLLLYALQHSCAPTPSLPELDSVTHLSSRREALPGCNL